MNVVRKYERLRHQLTDLADELDGEGQDVLSAFATEAAEIMRGGLDEVGITSYREWHARQAATREADAEVDAREQGS